MGTKKGQVRKTARKAYETNLAKRTGGAPKHPILAKQSVSTLRKKATAIRAQKCPPAPSKLKKAELIAYINKHK